MLSLYFSPSSDAAVVARSPFEDDWYVFQGGNSALVNHHFFGSSNKYALDLVIAEDIALPMTGVLELDQYATFGTAVFAPVAGVVVKVESAIDDQPVGHIDHINPTGNYVVIQVSPDVHVILAHLQQESLKVSEGEVVAQGQLLGNIGNSGQSSQPHLHIHAMTGADMFDPDSQPLPIVWQTRAEPVHLRRNETLTGFAS